MKTRLIHSLIFTLSLFTTIQAQDRYAPFEKMVSTSNGQFSLSVPIGSVSSVSGQSYSIGIPYSGNVQMNQPASMVGLGWNFDVGSIRRTVMTCPDDHSDYLETKRSLVLPLGTEVSGSEENLVRAGSMYSQSVNGTSVYSDATYVPSLTGQGQGLVQDFDQFYFTGNGLSGTFSLDYYPSILNVENGNLTNENPIQLMPSPYEAEINQVQREFSPLRQMDSEGQATIPFQNPWLLVLSNDPTGNVYIRQYTKDAVTNQNTDDTPGFIRYSGISDYVSGNLASLGSEEIVAFTAVTPDGMQYHYSLPVLQLQSITNLYDIDAGTVQNASYDEIVSTKIADYVVTEWKLTAITGPNYRDLNSNGIVDDGDDGHWVAFSYSHWGDLYSRFPYYGLHYNPGPNEDELKDLEEVQLNQLGVLSLSKEERYYIEKIETDREVMVFYKDYRDDEYSLSSANEAIPNFYLKRVAKYHKDGQLSLNLNASSHPSPNSIFATPPSTSGVYFESDYFGTESQLLGSIEFVYDYSLQPEYDGNINNYHSGSKNYLSSGEDLSLIELIDRKSSLNSGGKLTLLNVIYHDHLDQELERYTFGYSSLNPTFQVNNHDQNGNYVDLSAAPGLRMRNLNTSQDNQSHNWLIDEITLPSDVHVEVEYEEALYRYTIQGLTESWENYIPVYFDHPNEKAYLLSDDHKKIFYNNSGIARTVRGHFYHKNALATSNYSGNVHDVHHIKSVRVTNINSTGLGFDSQGVSTGKGISYAGSSTREVGFIGGTVLYNPAGTSDYTTGPWYYIDDVYLSFVDEYYRTGISRVKELRVKKDINAQDYAKLEYEYLVPRASLKKFETVYLGAKRGVSFGSNFNNHNSSDRGVLYEQVVLKKIDKNSNLISTAKFQFDLQREVDVRSEVSLKELGKCYLPFYWLNYSPAAFYKFTRENPIVSTRSYQGPFTNYPKSWAELAPRIMVDAFNYYLQNYYQYNNLNPSDSDVVENHLPTTPFYSMDGVFINSARPSLYTGQTTCSCEGSVVNTVTPSGSGPPYEIVYTLPPRPYGNDEDMPVYLSTIINRYHGRLGRLNQMEVFDGLGNLQISKDYFYGEKGFKANSYYAHMQNSYTSGAQQTTTTAYKYKTHYIHRYEMPLKIVTRENGQVLSENILAIDPETAAAQLILNMSAESYQAIEKTYFNTDNSFEKWNKISPLTSVTEETGYQRESTRYVLGDINSQTTPWYEYYTDASSQRLLRKNLQDISKENTIKHYLPNQNFLNQFYRMETGIPTGNPLKKIRTVDQFNSNENYITLDVSTLSASSSVVSYAKTVIAPLAGRSIVPSGTITRVSTIFSPSENNLLANESEIQIIDPSLNVLQSYNVKANIFSSKRYYNSLRVPFVESATLPLSSYSATGFEDINADNFIFEGNFFLTSYQESATTNGGVEAHTGKYYLKLPQDASYKTIYHDPNLDDFETGQSYEMSLWIRTANLSGDPRLRFAIVGETISQGQGTPFSVFAESYLSNISEKFTFGDWTQIKMSFEVPLNFQISQSTYTFDLIGGGQITADAGLKIEILNAGGSTIIDDVRFHPAASPIEVVVYDTKFKRVTAKLDALNIAGKLVYDSKGRVIQLYAEDTPGFYLSKQTNYHD